MRNVIKVEKSILKHILWNFIFQMQIAQIHESETDVRWQYPEEIKECHNCHKALKSGKDKVGSRNSKLW